MAAETTADRLQELLAAVPFVPFTVRVQDLELPVSTPDYLFIPFDPMKRLIRYRQHWIPVADIAAIEPAGGKDGG